MSVVRENATSLYSQIAGRLKEEIAAGRFEPSGRLPSEAEIGERFGVSRVTVRLALDELDREGLIERRKGKGTFLAGRQVRHELDTLRSFHESLKMQGLNATMRIIRLGLVTTPPDIAPLLGARSACLERLHLVDREPIAVGRSYLPSALAALSPKDAARRPTYTLLTRLTGQEITRASVAIGAESASRDLADSLDVALGAALLVMERTSFFESGSCAERSTFHVRPERYRFVLGSEVVLSRSRTPTVERVKGASDQRLSRR
jgi:GntR family transcriptional regulator